PVTSTAEVLMEIPTNVINLAQSFLYADIAIAPQGAANHIWWHTDGCPIISEVDLYTRSGIYLCQLPNFQNYMKIVRKLHTSRKEYDSNDASSFLYPSQSLPNVPPGITPNNGPASQAYEEAGYIMSDAAMGIAPTGNNATA